MSLPRLCLVALVAARLLSARLNTIHDCDEAFNFLEPLHFLLYGSGSQTWEHSPRFALRSYLYLLLHAAPLWPATLALGNAGGKRVARAGVVSHPLLPHILPQVFYLLRALLGTASAAAEWRLCQAAARTCGRRLGLLLWALLLPSAALFASSTTLLPSTFAMVAFTAGAALCLDERPQAAVAVCTVGGLLGWPFAGLAAVPVGVVALRSSGVARTARTLALSASTLLPCFAADWALYGRPTLGVWNLVAYNVVGNDSGLYGTEPASFYFRAALNALNLALPLALAGPLAELLVAWALRRRPRWALALVGLSFHLWVGAMSCVPHKEDRFLYPVYAHALLAAATALDVGCEAGGALGRRGWLPGAGRAAAAASALLVLLAAALSLSRSAALVSNYGAPMRLLAGLAPLTSPGASALLCVGDEWYRFPSSFFLPGDGYSLGFVQQPGGFAGALPARFGPLPGWSSAAGAAPWLNDRNAAAPQQWVVDPDQRCDLWLGLASEAPPGGAAAGWTAVARAPFLDAARSPALWRAFRVPLISARRNTFVEMVLLSRQRAPTQP